MPTTHPAMWGYSDEKSDLLAAFMDIYSMDSYSGRKIYWIINFCFWLLRKIRRVEDILPFLCPKKSRFSSLQSVIDFCIVQLETEVASNQGKKSLLYCSRTRVLFREMRKTWFWELEGKKVICRHVHISMSSVDLYPYCIWLPTIQ